MARTYTTQSGDTFDGIAKKMYGDELRADVIIRANLEHVTTFKFDAGVQLSIPDIEVQEEGMLPPWKVGEA